MSAHDPAHELVLQRALAGARGDGEPELRALLAGCAVCRDEWSGLRAAAERIDAAFAERRADEDLAREISAAPGEERVRETLRALQRSGAPFHGVADRRRRIWIGAAAVALIALGAWWTLARAPVPPSPTLGSDVRLVRPTAGDPDTSAFEFAAPLPAGGYYEVIVRDARAPASVIARSGRLHAPRWEPTADERSRIPASFEWEARVYNGGGVLERSRSVRVGAP